MALLTRLKRVFTGNVAPVADPVAMPRIEPVPVDPEQATAQALLDDYLREPWEADRYWVEVDPRETATGRAILAADARIQIAVLGAAVAASSQVAARRPWTWEIGHDTRALETLLKTLARRKLAFTAADVERVLHHLAAHGDPWTWQFPLHAILGALARSDVAGTVTPASRASLIRLHAAGSAQPVGKRLGPTLERINDLLGVAKSAEDFVDACDDWGSHTGEFLTAIPAEERDAWIAILHHAATATGTTPSAKWRKVASERVAALGADRFAATVIAWLDPLGRSSANTSYRDGGGVNVPSAVLAERNATLLRGLVWCCAQAGTPAVARALGAAAEACFKKVPGVGARSLKVGNACLWALGELPGTDGAVQLLRLRYRVTFPSARKPIEAAIDRAATRAGMSRDDLADLAVPTYDLVDGRRRVAFGDRAAEIVVTGGNRVAVEWFGADGKPRRTEPAEVKRAFPDERKALNATVADLKTMLTAQRDRIERLLLSERDWPLDAWRERYLDHPLLSTLTRPLIWRFANDDRVTLGAWRDGEIVGVDDLPLTGLSAATRVRLWHPVGSEAGVVDAWQRWLEGHGIVQPFKQAHREVYVLTDAERQTATYSNRFAGHLLRQHQFLALCQARGWRYRLQGGFDGSDTPTIELPDHGLSVEYWVSPVTEGEASMTEAGMSYLISTDQVRFIRRGDRQSIPIADVPAIVLTELLRDVDLFVGVASVGNDPTWRDQGPERYRRYWTDYAFGDLSASAETRRVVLGRLLPRLKIADQCALTDKFLVVRGERRTYNIHLGSGNIMMEPNNQYLCIVPDRGAAAKDPAADVFLPFEGDTQLGVILSKAFLLANDTAITDKTILRQLDR